MLSIQSGLAGNQRLSPPKVGDSARGFSMIEMLVSIIIIVLLMSAVFPFLFQAQKRFQGNVVVSEANQSARAGLEVMSQEIGQAGFNPQFTTNMTSDTGVTTNGCPQSIHISSPTFPGGVLTGINPGDWVSVDTGANQELLEVFSTSNAVTTRSCAPCGTCAAAPATPWIQAKFLFNHTAPYNITSYKMPYASGVLVSFDSSGNLVNSPDCTSNRTNCAANPGNYALSNDQRLMFYGDINQDGVIRYVVYSISPMVPATSVTINGNTYTLYNLYRSISPVVFPSLPTNTAYTGTDAQNQDSSPMIEKVIYDATNRQGPTGYPIFDYPSHQQIGTAPNVYTALGTIVITLCVAVNPQAMETHQVTWYTMATQIRPLNLAAAINVNNSYGGLYLPPTPMSLPMSYSTTYYP